jgi:SNF2 family DNA or RNA helicase
MNSSKPILLIRAKGSDSVCLIKTSEIDQQLWGTVVSWWSSVGTHIEDTIEVPTDAFLSQSLWLRSRWVKDGGRIDLDEDTKSILANAKKDFEAFKNSLEEPRDVISNVDESLLSRTLTSFQKEGVSRLLQLNSGANFSVPGAGKTTMTLALWSQLLKQGKVERMLVVSPKSAFEAWMEEPNEVLSKKVKSAIFDFAPIDQDIDILIVNFERLENDDALARLERWLSQKSALLVIDEAHRIKGGVNSIRWRRCKALSLRAKRVDILTGTPMPQDFDDLRNLFSITWPNVPRTYLTNSLLSSMKRNSIYVRTTKDELKLPPVTIIPKVIRMGDIQREIYAALKKAYVQLFSLSSSEKSYFSSKGRAVMNLLAASTNPGLLAKVVSDDAYLGLEWPPRELSDTKTLIELVSKYASVEMPPKYIWIRERCEQAARNGSKVLIWSTLVGNILALAKVLAPLNPAVVYGAVTNDERSSEIDRFRNDPSCGVLISNAQTLGEGISLHKDCHEAIYLDRSYNAGHYLQSLDRIHRLGLPKNQETTIYVLMSQHTIDERISERLEEKIENLALALNDDGLMRNSLPDESAIYPDEVLGIDQYDLQTLFAHLASDER